MKIEVTSEQRQQNLRTMTIAELTSMAAWEVCLGGGEGFCWTVVCM